MNLAEKESNYFFHTYKRIPLEIERGDGVHLYTRGGVKYLDMFAGLAVNALGYNHPRIVRAITEQCSKYIHLSNYYLQEPQILLAEKLSNHSGYEKIFLCNSGTEAIEGAMKLTRKWGSTRGKNQIISFTNSFHGRTMGALSLMDREKYKNGFEPFLQNCNVIEYNNIDFLRNIVNENTTAVILEFIQGEGGIRTASKEFISTINELKNKYGFLIVADEIQSGIGRTGKFFAFQHYECKPDVVVIAKPIGGGLPLGAILCNKNIAETFSPGVHGTTFGGNPVACAAGIEVLDEIMENGFMKNAERMGELFKSKLFALKNIFPSLIKEVRGCGLMIGVELTQDAEPIVTAMRERNILINGTDQTVLRFLPPLIIEEKHIEQTIVALEEVFKTLAK